MALHTFNICMKLYNFFLIWGLHWKNPEAIFSTFIINFETQSHSAKTKHGSHYEVKISISEVSVLLSQILNVMIKGMVSYARLT